MKSAEFLRKIKKAAKVRGVEFEIFPAKGSHHKIRVGNKTSILPMHAKELPTGTYRKILKDLDLTEEEL